jgi:hypothetical protein
MLINYHICNQNHCYATDSATLSYTYYANQKGTGQMEGKNKISISNRI